MLLGVYNAIQKVIIKKLLYLLNECYVFFKLIVKGQK